MLLGRIRCVIARRRLRLGFVGARRRLVLSARLLLGLVPLLRTRRLGLLAVGTLPPLIPLIPLFPRIPLVPLVPLVPLFPRVPLLPLVPTIGGDHARIMLGMLEEVFGADPVSG